SGDNNGNMTITLDSNYRFSIELNGNSNVQLNGNQIIIRNLNYYKKIGVSDSNLLNLRKTIQNYIDMNFVTSSTINSNIANINNLVSSVQTTNNDGNLGDYVNSVTVSGATITIPLRSGIKMDTKSIPNITVNETSISISGFTYYVQATPVTSYFTWSGNTITGLTSSGNSQKTLTLPSSATGITNNAFQNKTNVEVIDMSLSQITNMPAGSSTSGIFYGCTKLRAVKLPNACTFIGYGAFYNCASIVDITLPPNLTTFGRYGLSGCTGIKSFTLPNKVTSVGQYLFNGCSNMTTIKLSEIMPWLNHYMFNNCSSLQEVYIPNSVTEIRSYVFNGCRNLAWVRMSDNISTIDTNAFNGASNTLIVYVSTQALKTKLTNMNLVNLPSSRIFVGTPS
ncbi:MAG: leucine-rich repeat domain-containing protein, partial [Ureaplasma sp.]|nr:leucine-rich repeat domain-containing protein [Ureaplasma sp.]